VFFYDSTEISLIANNSFSLVFLHAYGKEITAELARKAAENDCLNVKNTEGIIIHSDLGTQYTSQLFENYIDEEKMIHLFSRKAIHMITPALSNSIWY